MKAHSQDPAPYTVDTRADDDVIAHALRILDRRIRTGPIFDSPQSIREFLRVYFADAQAQNREEFAVLLLDSQHRLIDTKTLFSGTLNQTAVYPREVIREALASGAAAVVFAHNHPSGDPDPSRADEVLTRTLKDALKLVDVRTLDHFIVGDTVLSFAERGLI
jgi:DNA repair protein RadC